MSCKANNVRCVIQTVDEKITPKRELKSKKNRPSNGEIWHCYNCSYKAKKKITLIKHVAKHMDSNGEGNACEYCCKKFRTDRHLRDHVRRNHLYNDLHCYHCSYTTKLKFLLDKHVQKHLDPLASPVISKYSCTLCEGAFGKFECAERPFMLNHYIKSHGVLIKTVKLHFENFEKFHSWKAELEKTELCRYVSRGGGRSTPGFTIHWFRCFRDGVYKSKSKGKRKLKNKGTLKINSICPSSIRAAEVKGTGSIEVNYIPVHVGHGKDLEMVNLSNEEKKELAEQLAANISFSAVLASLKSSMNDSGGVERIHLTTRKDLWNIRRSFNVSANNQSTTLRATSESPTDELVAQSSDTDLNEADTSQIKVQKPPTDHLPSLDQPTQTPVILLKQALPPGPTKERVYVSNAVNNAILTDEEVGKSPDDGIIKPEGEPVVEAWIDTMKEPSLVRFYESQAPLLAENSEGDSASYVTSEEFADRKKLLINQFLKLIDSAATEADLGILESHFSPILVAAQQEIFKNHVRIGIIEPTDVVNVVCDVTNYE